MAEPVHPVIWRGRQWAVTEYGLELVGKNYAYDISRNDLFRPLNIDGRTWREHLMEKRWFDVEDFDCAVHELKKDIIKQCGLQSDLCSAEPSE